MTVLRIVTTNDFVGSFIPQRTSYGRLPGAPLRLVARVPATSSRTEALESQARRLLERARERNGASVERMVKAFGQLRPRGAVTRRSWYDWQERPETVSLLPGLAAMHGLGPKASMQLEFGEGAGVGPAWTPRPVMPGWISSSPRSKDAMTGLMQLRERVEASSSLNCSGKASCSPRSWPT